VLKMADRRWGDGAEMAVLELVDHAPIDRKRKPKSAEQAAAKAKEAAAAPQDPFGKFRKLFSDKSKVTSKGKVGKGAAKTGAARKTPAAGGANKSGGSGS
jgi:hypothetical protein